MHIHECISGLHKLAQDSMDVLSPIEFPFNVLAGHFIQIRLAKSCYNPWIVNWTYCLVTLKFQLGGLKLFCLPFFNVWPALSFFFAPWHPPVLDRKSCYNPWIVNWTHYLVTLKFQLGGLKLSRTELKLFSLLFFQCVSCIVLFCALTPPCFGPQYKVVQVENVRSKSWFSWSK